MHWLVYLYTMVVYLKVFGPRGRLLQNDNIVTFLAGFSRAKYRSSLQLREVVFLYCPKRDRCDG